MQSSAAVFCRALVMLAFLIGVPMAAFSGTSWTEMGKRLQAKWQELRLPNLSSLLPSSTPAVGSEAPPFQPPPNAIAGQPQPAGVFTPNSSAQALSSAAPAPAAGANSEPSGVVPAGFQAALGPSNAAQPAIEPPQGPPLGATDQFGQIQGRLRQLGATYYLLESWGNDQQLYRFYCKVAVGGNPNYTRYFEATNTNPLQAMLGVLQQVEAWREGAGRQ